MVGVCNNVEKRIETNEKIGAGRDSQVDGKCKLKEKKFAVISNVQLVGNVNSRK